ncbi:MAG: maltotransferase domain-containing protein, partial [Thermoanaerobaculia bacterium]
MKNELEGRRRVVIEGLAPEVDCGRFPCKRVVGESVVVEADVLCDGHDLVSARLLWKKAGNANWNVAPMKPLVNDRWRGEFRVAELGFYVYTVEGWVDHFKTWHRDLIKRVDAGQDVSVDFLIGAELIESAAARADDVAATRLREGAATLRGTATSDEKLALVFGGELARTMAGWNDPSLVTRYDRELSVEVDPLLARTGAWYEFFPRSTSGTPGRHGTFRDASARLDYVAKLGFDILYLPPIHPIGTTARKGPNNTPIAKSADPGSPWAIGSEAGGHTAVHPELGTLDDFRAFVKQARALGIEIALDMAFQASPDHPWVKQHPDFFKARPDGTVQYAENPPKKYQDIYPFDFESKTWLALWGELREVFEFWIDEGIRVFRVDNPHTKPLPFWEW